MVMFMEILMLVILLYLLFMFMSLKGDSDEMMMSMYECGFDSVMVSRVGFSYRFFLISILFLIFDVEITLLVVIPYFELDLWQNLGVFMFMFILLGGLLYEYFNGILSWIEVENS